MLDRKIQAWNDAFRRVKGKGTYQMKRVSEPFEQKPERQGDDGISDEVKNERDGGKRPRE